MSTTEQPTAEQHVDREPSATVTLRPTGDDEITLTAESYGMAPARVAYGLRMAADTFDVRARAAGDEPIPYGPAAKQRAEVETLRARVAELETETAALQRDKEHVAQAAEARVNGTARRLAEQITALGKARGWSTWAADYIHPEREFVDTGEQAATDDPRPRIEIDLEQPAEPERVEERPAVPTVVDCAHGYGLMRDSCPGCDHETETPHDADPVTIRPTWAKRNMRRCRRCGCVPSHPIHRAPKAQP
ncbi:hypothetical protein [Streptomyces pseudogriseolus]|uniref:hypothetical protein n=1 Tax=Streptomyces pseudogriseolus TaxID=36817 RepID=UPI003FA22EE0